MQDVRKGSLVRYIDDFSATVLKLGSTIGVVSSVHHEDLVVILTNGMTFIDRRERFIVLSY